MSKENAIREAIHFFMNALDYQIFHEVDEIKAKYVLNKLLESQKETYCIWTFDPLEKIYDHKTSCGRWDTGGKDKIFCPYCGKKIRIKE